jgi:hypothetical protein
LTERRVLWTKQPRAPSNEHVLTEGDPSNSLCASQPGARPRTQPVVYTIRGIPSFNYSAREPAFFRHYNRLEHSPTRNHTCIPNKANRILFCWSSKKPNDSFTLIGRNILALEKMFFLSQSAL